MIRNSFKFILISIFASVLYLIPACLSAQWSILLAEEDSLTRLGSNYIYNVQFDSAEICFKEVITRNPGHPAGYFLEAMVDFWKIRLYRESKMFDDSFMKKIDKTIEICDKILDTNEYDLTALFFKGGALGYRGQYYALREDWIPAAKDGKNGFDILVKCYNKAPGNHDIMLGTGVYNYFAEVLPEKYPILSLVAPFLPKGDKILGVLQLKASAKYARYTRTEAKVVLLQIYYSFEDDEESALEVAKELYDTYPNNPYFHRYLGRCYITNGMLNEYEATWREILNRFIARKQGYDRTIAREALYYIGIALKARKNWDMALKYFYKCDEACRVLDKNGPSGFMVKLNLYIASIYENQGKFDLAIKQYNKLLSWKDYENSHKTAKYLINNIKERRQKKK